MLKRKLLMTILPVLSAAVIAGAGFSAWHFNGTVDSNETINVGTIVTDANDGIVTVVTKDTAPKNLTLDQGTGGLSDDSLGITFDADWTISVTFPTATSYSNFTIKLEVTIADSLANYVTLDGSKNSSVNSNFNTAGSVSDKTLTFTSSEISVNAGKTVDYTFTLNNVGETHNNVMNYKSKPQSYDAWSTMYDALNGESNLVTLTATVDAK